MPAQQPDTAAGWRLPLDVAEKDDTYIVQASLPGVDPEAIDITLEDDVLTIEAEMVASHELTHDDYHIRERRLGQFSRSLRFPMAVDADAVEASYQHGVLTLTIPKVDEARARKITIRQD